MKENRKVYARQVPWEWQESPWDDEQLKIDKAALYGNRSYGRYVFDEFEQVVKALEEMDWEDVGTARLYSTEQEMLLDYVPPVGRDSYTDEEIEAWKFACQMYNPNYGRNEQWGICMGLTLMLGKEYDYKTLRGSCQSDWIYFIYPADLYDDEAVRCLETEFFNTGEEWIVHDEETVPECAEDVQGYSIYVYDNTRKEIAEAEGVDPEDVVLWEYDGMRQVPKYKEA